MAEEALAKEAEAHARWKWVMPLHSTTSDVLIIRS
jgi:hypothetical protein